MTYVSHELEGVVRAAQKGSIGLVRDFNELTQLQSAPKGHEEFTKAAIDRTLFIIRAELNRLRKDMPVVTSGNKLPMDESFVVSPLNGHLNFMRSIPYFAVSIAHVKRGEIIYGVVYNPSTGDTYMAEKGAGAFKEESRSNSRLRVSVRNDLSTSLLSMSQKCQLRFKDVEVRAFGSESLDLAYVASGKMDVFVSQNANMADVLAGALLVREAGGRIFTTTQSEECAENFRNAIESGNMIAGNAVICKKLFEQM